MTFNHSVVQNQSSSSLDHFCQQLQIATITSRQIHVQYEWMAYRNIFGHSANATRNGII